MALLDTLSVVDIFLSLRTTFHNKDGDEIFNTKAMARKYFCSLRSIQDILLILPLNYLVKSVSQPVGMGFLAIKAFKLAKYISFMGNPIIMSITNSRSVKFTILFLNLFYIIYCCSLSLIILTPWDMWKPPLFYELEADDMPTYSSQFHRMMVAFYYTSVNYLGD